MKTGSDDFKEGLNAMLGIYHIVITYYTLTIASLIPRCSWAFTVREFQLQPSDKKVSERFQGDM